MTSAGICVPARIVRDSHSQGRKVSNQFLLGWGGAGGGGRGGGRMVVEGARECEESRRLFGI